MGSSHGVRAPMTVYNWGSTRDFRYFRRRVLYGMEIVFKTHCLIPLSVSCARACLTMPMGTTSRSLASLDLGEKEVMPRQFCVPGLSTSV